MQIQTLSSSVIYIKIQFSFYYTITNLEMNTCKMKQASLYHNVRIRVHPQEPLEASIQHATTAQGSTTSLPEAIPPRLSFVMRWVLGLRLTISHGITGWWWSIINPLHRCFFRRRINYLGLVLIVVTHVESKWKQRMTKMLCLYTSFGEREGFGLVGEGDYYIKKLWERQRKGWGVYLCIII